MTNVPYIMSESSAMVRSFFDASAVYSSIEPSGLVEVEHLAAGAGPHLHARP